MIRYEYVRIDLNQHHPRSDALALLGSAGQQGWRLVCVTANNIAYLIREIDDPAAPSTSRRRTRPEPGPTEGA
jgi:hypothetical protein